MRFPPERDEQSRFSGHLRHYHRTGGPQRTWEEWVEADGARPRKASSWLKRGAVLFAILALIGIVVGLIIELS